MLAHRAPLPHSCPPPPPCKHTHALPPLPPPQALHWAVETSRLVNARCDTKSALEADAYAAWLHGNLLLEKETDWELALAKFVTAK